MKEKITYIAEDGTEFDNRDECVAYEVAFSNQNVYGVTLKSGDWRDILDFNATVEKSFSANSIEGIIDILETCNVVYIRDEVILNFIQDKIDDYYTEALKVGWNIFNENEYTWDSLDWIMNIMEEAIKQIKSLMKRV